ncbi:MAG TPA: Na+/H+ antiporter NhaA [Kofleriaceae bacterium]
MKRPYQSPPEAWRPVEAAARKLAEPMYRFFALEAASGLLLFAAVAAALIWANLASGSYQAVWSSPVGFELAGWHVERTLHFWVNEGLMTIFFFVVGLEIRRELYEGELSNLRRAALPLATALGGVLLPIAIFVLLNHGRAGAGGWAIPMATDIAFALGVLSLLGSRVPAQLRILLLALAVIDDIAAIVVIAIWFGGSLAWQGFALAGIGIALAFAFRIAGLRASAAYLLPGAVVWFGLYTAGVHPTLAGVLLGLLTPVRPWFGPSGFKQTTEHHLRDLEGTTSDELIDRLDQINLARREAISPAERLIHRLHPWVAFVVMPGFALANAGVVLGGSALHGDGLWLFAGIVLGLAAGKPLGIAVAASAAARLGVARAPGMALVGMVGGIGFTMSLFIAQLAFADGPMLETAKLAVLVGSALATLFALGYGRFALALTR